MRIAELQIFAPVEPWERIGLTSHPMSDGDERMILVPGLVLRVSPGGPSSVLGLRSWTFVDESTHPQELSTRRVETSIDGIPTWIKPDNDDVTPDAHRLGIVDVDHVVVMTGSLDRTSAAITEVTGLPLRRVRDAGSGVRQGFHKSGSVVLEVVERPDLGSEPSASLWGFVFTVEDLDDIVEWLGPDVIGSPRNAVQPGRRIATVRSETGLGVPLALMSPPE